MLPKNSCVWFFHTIEKGENPLSLPHSFKNAVPFLRQDWVAAGGGNHLFVWGSTSRIESSTLRVFSNLFPFRRRASRTPWASEAMDDQPNQIFVLLFLFSEMKGRKSNLARYLAAFLRATFGRSRPQTSSPPKNRKLFQLSRWCLNT